VRDADGFHCFCGRADDLIKIGGAWVYPLELELMLLDHPWCASAPCWPWKAPIG